MSRLPSSFQWLLLAAVCLLGVAYWQKHRQWQVVRASQSAQQAALGARLAESEETITQLAGQVDALDTALGEARTKLTAADTRYVETARELSTAKTRIEELEQATRDLNDLQAAHAALGKEVAALREAADPALPAAFTRVMKELEGRLIQENTPPVPVPVLATSRARGARVVSVGPSQAFVVLDYGAEHGALPLPGNVDPPWNRNPCPGSHQRCPPPSFRRPSRARFRARCLAQGRFSRFNALRP
jgi:hypothetical protein